MTRSEAEHLVSALEAAHPHPHTDLCVRYDSLSGGVYHVFAYSGALSVKYPMTSASDWPRVIRAYEDDYSLATGWEMEQGYTY